MLRLLVAAVALVDEEPLLAGRRLFDACVCDDGVVASVGVVVVAVVAVVVVDVAFGMPSDVVLMGVLIDVVEKRTPFSDKVT